MPCSSKPKSVLESDFTSAAHEWAMLRGWFTFKVESPTMNGLPDRFYARRGVVVFVEWKRPLGEVRKQQAKRIKEMREHGIAVYVFDDLDEFKKVMR